MEQVFRSNFVHSLDEIISAHSDSFALIGHHMALIQDKLEYLQRQD